MSFFFFFALVCVELGLLILCVNFFLSLSNELYLPLCVLSSSSFFRVARLPSASQPRSCLRVRFSFFSFFFWQYSSVAASDLFRRAYFFLLLLRAFYYTSFGIWFCGAPLSRLLRYFLSFLLFCVLCGVS